MLTDPGKAGEKALLARCCAAWCGKIDELIALESLFSELMAIFPATTSGKSPSFSPRGGNWATAVGRGKWLRGGVEIAVVVAGAECMGPWPEGGNTGDCNTDDCNTGDCEGCWTRVVAARAVAGEVVTETGREGEACGPELLGDVVTGGTDAVGAVVKVHGRDCVEVAVAGFGASAASWRGGRGREGITVVGCGEKLEDGKDVMSGEGVKGEGNPKSVVSILFSLNSFLLTSIDADFA